MDRSGVPLTIRFGLIIHRYCKATSHQFCRNILNVSCITPYISEFILIIPSNTHGIISTVLVSKCRFYSSHRCPDFVLDRCGTFQIRNCLFPFQTILFPCFSFFSFQVHPGFSLSKECYSRDFGGIFNQSQSDHLVPYGHQQC